MNLCDPYPRRHYTMKLRKDNLLPSKGHIWLHILETSKLKLSLSSTVGSFLEYYVMDFDHVRGKKHANVMELIPTPSKKKIDEEIAKCEIVSF
jgi:hypothetical protein